MEQVKAWAPNIDHWDWERWNNSFTHKFVYIAEEKETLLGFGELEADGHIDRFYIHKNYLGRGVGRLIYQAIEKKAKALALSRLYVEASITALPFFEKMEFKIITSQIVKVRGVEMMNYQMEKMLYSNKA